MNPRATPTWIAFAESRQIAAGQPAQVAAAVKDFVDANPLINVLMFDALTSRTVELDLRGSHEDVLRQLPEPSEPGLDGTPATAKPGRPKLGVVAREVTLLPRHWAWLSSQPGGASVTLRKLVEQALRENKDTDRRRMAQEAAYRFMNDMAGDEAGFEEATRALFAGDYQGLLSVTAQWPNDVRQHALDLAAQAIEDQSTPLVPPEA